MAKERMYELAFRYKKAKLWQRMFDSELFAVKLSDGKIGYCSIMGRMGELNAVAVYVGDEGFQTLRNTMSAASFSFDEPDDPTALLKQDCTQCVFTVKDELSPTEADEVRAYARAHGIRLAGANAFPQFVRYMPYRYPWEPDEQDQQRICEVLEASVYLAELLKTTDREQLGLALFDQETEALPLLERDADGFAVKTTPVPPEIPDAYASPKLSNDLVAARLRRMKKKGTLQCELIRLFEPVQEQEGEIPYFPVVLLAVDEKTEMVMPPSPVTFFEDHPERAVDSFAETLLDNELCPGRIRVGNEQTFALLENLCKAAEIKLVKATQDKLGLLYAVKDKLLYGMDDEEEEDDGFEPEELYDLIMRLSDSELKQLPKAVVKQFLSYSDVGGLPPEVEARLRRLFRL